MNLKATLGILLIAATFSTYAQVAPADTVIFPLAKTSKIIYSISFSALTGEARPDFNSALLRQVQRIVQF